MGSLNVLALLVSVGESLKTALGLQVRALKCRSLGGVHRGLVPQQMLLALVVLTTVLAAERSLCLINHEGPYHVLVHVQDVSCELVLLSKARVAFVAAELS